MEHMFPIDAEGPLIGSIATLVGVASVAVFKLRHCRGSDTPDEDQSNPRVTMPTAQNDAGQSEKAE